MSRTPLTSRMSTATAMRTPTTHPTLMACDLISQVQSKTSEIGRHRSERKGYPCCKAKYWSSTLSCPVSARSMQCDTSICYPEPDHTEHGHIMNKLSDMNVLYDAFLASMKGSAWKEEPQRFEIDFLTELSKLSRELEDRTYKTSESTTFIFRERGKERLIHGGRMRDRVVRHALCDAILTPSLKPYLTKLSSTYRYLQIRYSLTDTGRVIRRISQKNVTRERRKLKAYRHLVDAGRITEDNVEECFRSWLGMQQKYMSNIQIINMITLYYELFRKELTWKSNSRLRYLTAQCSITSD